MEAAAHPRLGAVEIRALDAQAFLADTGALVALVHCLARDAAERESVDDPPPELVEEGMFRAARFGVEGQLPDTQGNRRAVSVLLDEALGRADAWAGELGCAEKLARLPDLLERGGGAGTQRSSYEIAGIGAVLRELLDRTRGT